MNILKNSKKLKVSIIILFFLILISILGVLVYNFLNKESDEDKYYALLMKDYGFNIFYDNKKTNSNEVVNRSELVKMVIASNLNLGINSKNKYNDVNYKNDGYVYAAVKYNILVENDINIDNYSKPATLKELVDYLSKAKQSILSLKLTDNKKYSFKDTDTLITSYLNDMIENGIIEENIGKLDRKIKKRDVNKYIVKYVQRYNTLSPFEEQINNDKKSLPSNYEIYPYTVKGVDNIVYELPFKVSLESEYINPKTLYINYKESLGEIKTNIEEYVKTVYSIDYTKINASDFARKFR